MRLEGPERYELTFTDRKYVVRCARGTLRFSGIGSSEKQKIYVVSDAAAPFYVGATRRPLRGRFGSGWRAQGKNGYHGYAWRRELTNAVVDVWALEGSKSAQRDAETIEAEIVFLIRCAGQWPLHQTEIHFHVSTPQHRKLAAEIAQRYGITPES